MAISKKMMKMSIERRSPVTGEMNLMEMEINMDDFHSWKSEGVLIQDAMPYLSLDEREFLISGCTPQDWDTLSFNNSGE